MMFNETLLSARPGRQPDKRAPPKRRTRPRMTGTTACAAQAFFWEAC